MPVWEHFVLQAGYAMTGRRRYPAGPGREQIACTGMPEAPGTPAA